MLPGIVRTWNYQRQEHVMSLHANARGQIQGDNIYWPTTVYGSHQTIWIEPVGCYPNSYTLPVICFLMNFNKFLPCFTIPWMLHLFCIVHLPFGGPSHILGSFLGHMKPLDPFCE